MFVAFVCLYAWMIVAFGKQTLGGFYPPLCLYACMCGLQRIVYATGTEYGVRYPMLKVVFGTVGRYDYRVCCRIRIRIPYACS